MAALVYKGAVDKQSGWSRPEIQCLSFKDINFRHLQFHEHMSDVRFILLTSPAVLIERMSIFKGAGININ